VYTIIAKVPLVCKVVELERFMDVEACTVLASGAVPPCEHVPGVNVWVAP
jgi:hypothetical protein